MKRIESACLMQTVHFRLKEGLAREDAEKLITEEIAHFKAQMNRTRTRYVVDEERPQPDGSVVIKLRKQYNRYAVGEYLEAR